MKHLSLTIIIMVFWSVNTLFGQDTIKLINNDTLLVDIIQIDEIKVFFIYPDDSTMNISSYNLDKIKSIHLFGNNYTPEENQISEIGDTTYVFNEKVFGISLDVIPGLGFSLNFDVSERLNLVFGTGLLYTKLGGRIYLSDVRKDKRIFLSMYVYHFAFKKTNYLNFNIGKEFRKRHKINFLIEGGLYISHQSVFPLGSMGFGYRF